MSSSPEVFPDHCQLLGIPCKALTRDHLCAVQITFCSWSACLPVDGKILGGKVLHSGTVGPVLELMALSEATSHSLDNLMVCFCQWKNLNLVVFKLP